jgi:hypothetical protein
MTTVVTKDREMTLEEGLDLAADKAFGKFTRAEVEKYSKDIFDLSCRRFSGPMIGAFGKPIPLRAISDFIIGKMNVKTGRDYDTDVRCPYSRQDDSAT